MTVPESAPVVVTGASGFVGSALVRRLAHDGIAVRGAVRNAGRGGRHCVLGPVLGPDADWMPVLQGAGAVVHAAAHVHVAPNRPEASADAFRRINVEGTRRLASQAALAGVRRFVFLSSIGVHGSRSTRPFTEEDVPAPHSPYAASKLEAEQAVRDIGAATGMDWVIVRPPLVYGPGAPGNFARLARCVARGIPLPLGAVRNRRTLVALDNLVDLVVTCLYAEAAANQLFLAGDAESLSTPALLQALSAALQRKSGVWPVPVSLLRGAGRLLGRAEDIERLCGDLEIDTGKAQRLLGWRAPLSVAEGLRRAVAALPQEPDR